VFFRVTVGESRFVRVYVPSLRSARQWAIHYAYKQVLAIPRNAAAELAA
jgi:hypothetical protein